MKLNRLSLAHYRGFEQLDITFEPDITVIAGVNGVGKSALLAAIVRCLSHTLRTHCFSKEPPIGMVQADIKTGKDSLTVSGVFNYSNAEVQVDIARPRGLHPDESKALAERRDELRFAIRETKKSSVEEQELEDEIHSIERKLSPPEELVSMRAIPHKTQDETTQLNAANEHPIAVHYSTSRFLSRLPPVLPKVKGVEIATAYVRALDQLEISLNDFANWYRVLEESKDSERSSRIFNQLENAISEFLQDVSGLRLHDERPPRFSVQKNGETLYLEQLSDGERGLLALVFDLTRRLTIANPTSDNPLAEGVALVLIDEIELHLHPKWQREVLHRLKAVFTSSQFVVTTHSPLVLGEVESRCVRFLEWNNGKVVATVPQEALGLDANRILLELMEAPVRNRAMEEQLNELFDFIDDEQFNKARQAMEGLRAKLGEHDPELTRASSLLKFLEGEE